VLVLDGSTVLWRLSSWSSDRLERFREEAFVGGFERRFCLRQSLLSALAGLVEGESEDLSFANMLAAGGGWADEAAQSRSNSCKHLEGSTASTRLKDSK
jgi:hypothetical protein